MQYCMAAYCCVVVIITLSISCDNQTGSHRTRVVPSGRTLSRGVLAAAIISTSSEIKKLHIYYTFTVDAPETPAAGSTYRGLPHLELPHIGSKVLFGAPSATLAAVLELPGIGKHG